MTIKASASVTLSSYRDTEAVTRYYKLVSSTASAPSKPTTNPPSGWDDTEPSYTSGSTNTLYFCDLTKFSDGTWAYSAVSKSSSYEAAKEAYNKAQNAQDTANSANGKIDDLEIGGRNLLKQYIRAGQLCTKIDDLTVKVGTGVGDTYFWLRSHCALIAGETYTISCEASNVPDGCNWSFGVRVSNSTWQLYINKNGKIFATGVLDANIAADTEFLIDDMYEKPSTAPNIILTNFKLEKGNKATDWTPAPEDMVDKANIVSCINQTPESITIQANKISLEGLITANSNFKILSDGSMETISGKIGGWSIGNNKIYSENQLNVSLNNKVGTSYVSLVSDNSNNDEAISVIYDYLENGVADDRTPGTDYVKIFNDGRLKLGSEGIWADDTPSIYTTEIKGSSITLTGSDQEAFKCLITEQDIQFASSVGGSHSLMSLFEAVGEMKFRRLNYIDEKFGDAELVIAMNAINGVGYFTFNCGWIRLQFQVANGYVYRRFCYGNNGWTAWVAI